MLMVITSCFNCRLCGAGQGLLHHRRSCSRWLREPPDDEGRGEVLLLQPVALQLLGEPHLLPVAGALLAGGGGQGCGSAHQFSWQTFTELSQTSPTSPQPAKTIKHFIVRWVLHFPCSGERRGELSISLCCNPRGESFPLICLGKTSWLLGHSHSPLRVNLTSLCFPRFNFSFLMNKIIMDSPSSTYSEPFSPRGELNGSFSVWCSKVHV